VLPKQALTSDAKTESFNGPAIQPHPGIWRSMIDKKKIKNT